jgi:uncharacterized protein (TIGR02246 family)
MLASFQSKDPAKMGADYASDATFMISGHPPISGADNIRKSLGEMAKDPGFKIDFANKKTDVASSGDLAYTEGTYSVGMTDPKTKKVMTEKGTYVTVFRKQSDGSWKAVEDVASPSGPAT